MDELEHQAAFDRNLATEQLRGLIDFARDALKSVTLINGGAAIALLAFAGHVWSTPETNSSLDTALAGPIVLFTVGVFFSASGSVAGYVTQYNYYMESICKKPFGNIRCFHIIAVILLFASLLSFFAGMILSIVTFITESSYG